MSFPLPPLIRGWRAAVLLVAVALCSPGTASAGCGDYITYPDTHKNGHATPMADTEDGATPAKTPCQGPNCSGKNRESPPAPATPVFSPTKEQARPSTPSDATGDETGVRFARDLDSPRPVRRANSIFHPPRLG